MRWLWVGKLRPQPFLHAFQYINHVHLVAAMGHFCFDTQWTCNDVLFLLSSPILRVSKERKRQRGFFKEEKECNQNKQEVRLRMEDKEISQPYYCLHCSNQCQVKVPISNNHEEQVLTSLPLSTFLGWRMYCHVFAPMTNSAMNYLLFRSTTMLQGCVCFYAMLNLGLVLLQWVCQPTLACLKNSIYYWRGNNFCVGRRGMEEREGHQEL